jgi:hypothetical protein
MRPCFVARLAELTQPQHFMPKLVTNIPLCRALGLVSYGSSLAPARQKTRWE